MDVVIKIEQEDDDKDPAISSTNDREVSDDMADACKTYCHICHKAFPLSSMRYHTAKEHNLQITQYKQIYGNFNEDESLISKMVYHKCHLCGKIVLLDSDRLGGHIRSTHKMKERDYKALFMTPRKAQQMRSRGKEHQQAELLDIGTDFTGNEEAMPKSNPAGRRATDCVIVKEEPASENPEDWTVAQTVTAIIRMEPDIAPEDIKAIRDHKINGKALLKFSFHELVTYGKMKLGLAMMLSGLVEEWKNKSQQFQ